MPTTRRHKSRSSKAATGAPLVASSSTDSDRVAASTSPIETVPPRSTPPRTTPLPSLTTLPLNIIKLIVAHVQDIVRERERSIRALVYAVPEGKECINHIELLLKIAIEQGDARWSTARPIVLEAYKIALKEYMLNRTASECNLSGHEYNDSKSAVIRAGQAALVAYFEPSQPPSPPAASTATHDPFTFTFTFDSTSTAPHYRTASTVTYPAGPPRNLLLPLALLSRNFLHAVRIALYPEIHLIGMPQAELLKRTLQTEGLVDAGVGVCKPEDLSELVTSFSFIHAPTAITNLQLSRGPVTILWLLTLCSSLEDVVLVFPFLFVWV